MEVETDGGVQTYGSFERAVWTSRLENVAVTPEGVVIRWLSRAGDTYEILKSRDLLRGFAPLATNLPATPPVNGYTDRTDKASSFYLIGSE